MNDKKYMEGFWTETNIPKKSSYNETEIGKKMIKKMNELDEYINLYSCLQWHMIEAVIHFINVLFHKGGKPDMRVISYCGSAKCRICGKDNGDSEYIINTNKENWTFPSGYMHYIVDHGVTPSKEFERFILELDIKSLKHPPIPTDKLVFDLNYLYMISNRGGLEYSS